MIPLWTSSSAEKLLDQFQKLVTLSILAAIVIILADAAAEKDVAFFGLKMAVNSAYTVAAVAFIVTILMIAQLCARLATIVRFSDSADAPKVLGAIFGHPWSLNPFSYFAPSVLSKANAAFGLGPLVFIWWLGLLAITQLWNRLSVTPDKWEYGFWIGYIVSGALLLTAILNGHIAIVEKVRLLAKADESSIELEQLKHALFQVILMRCVSVLIFSGLGYWIYYLFTHVGA